MLAVLRHLRRPLPAAAALAVIAAVLCISWLISGLVAPLDSLRSAGWPPHSRTYWELGDFGVRSYTFAGSALNGDPTVSGESTTASYACLHLAAQGECISRPGGLAGLY